MRYFLVIRQKINILKNKFMNRISFSKYDACHLYEMLIWSWVDEKKELLKLGISKKELKTMGIFGGCYECESIGKRLEKFIGEKEVKYIEKSLKGREQGSFSSPKRKI